MSRKSLMLKMLLTRSGWKRAMLIKKAGIFHCMGENCYYHPFKLPAEPHLISFGNNVFIATGVTLVTHDMSNAVFSNETGTHLLPVVGKIQIGNNVFIGANATIMPNVEVGNNCIVAAGAVVTHNIPEGEIWGGVPAAQIGTYEGLKNKCIAYNKDFREKTKDINISLYDKQIKYFWKD